MCERCKNPNKTTIQKYTIHKGDATRKVALCDECADTTRAVYKLTGGKATEAKEPSALAPAEDETPEEVQPTVAPLGQSRPSRAHRRDD